MALTAVVNLHYWRWYGANVGSKESVPQNTHATNLVSSLELLEAHPRELRGAQHLPGMVQKDQKSEEERKKESPTLVRSATWMMASSSANTASSSSCDKDPASISSICCRDPNTGLESNLGGADFSTASLLPFGIRWNLEFHPWSAPLLQWTSPDGKEKSPLNTEHWAATPGRAPPTSCIFFRHWFPTFSPSMTFFSIWANSRSWTWNDQKQEELTAPLLLAAAEPREGSPSSPGYWSDSQSYPEVAPGSASFSAAGVLFC